MAQQPRPHCAFPECPSLQVSTPVASKEVPGGLGGRQEQHVVACTSPRPQCDTAGSGTATGPLRPPLDVSVRLHRLPSTQDRTQEPAHDERYAATTWRCFISNKELCVCPTCLETERAEGWAGLSIELSSRGHRRNEDSKAEGGAICLQPHEKHDTWQPENCHSGDMRR